MANIEKLINIAYKFSLATTVTAPSAVESGLAIAYTGAIAASGVACLGISNMDAASGDNYTVIVSGEAPAIAGGTLSVGQAVTSNGSGKIVPALSGNYILGRALQTAAINQAFKVMITQEGPL